ncbi:hypothetical protein OUZ56_021078 [Daphnia magna]|uniref:Uncharacterized protein n=1 Tax=Daphnia magna TaxID=35525 RepID=A0ABQ9ZGD3_9CRUS|nr:hypothetical protein OUZ56_021078 [Daphnia magna]
MIVNKFILQANKTLVSMKFKYLQQQTTYSRIGISSAAKYPFQKLLSTKAGGDTASIDSPGRLPSAWLREAGRRAEDLEHFYRSD